MLDDGRTRLTAGKRGEMPAVVHGTNSLSTPGVKGILLPNLFQGNFFVILGPAQRKAG